MIINLYDPKVSGIILGISFILLYYFIKKLGKALYDEFYEHLLKDAKKNGVIVSKTPEYVVWEIRKWNLKIRIIDRLNTK